jgi:iron(III) transport system ATP-binding protein
MLEIKNLRKTFGKTVAVDNVSIKLKKKDEFLTLLGPSGCGKTTVLRMISGLLKPDNGKVFIDGEDITDIPPEKRNIGFVFQSYALFPHMTVFENVAFGLKLRKISENEIKKMVKESLELVGLTGLENRNVKLLSGGQQQRVGIARAISIKPSILLFDEPLSNLDAKLRESVRFELVELQKGLGVPSVYVTHDQSEAMVISDNIALMNKGRIEQIDTPYEIYKHPQNPFVADFIGASNFLPCSVIGIDRENGKAEVELSDGTRIYGAATREVTEGSKAVISIRPEDIEPVKSGGEREVKCIVRRRTFLGNVYDYGLEISGKLVRMKTLPYIKFDEKAEIAVNIQEGVVFKDSFHYGNYYLTA